MPKDAGPALFEDGELADAPGPIAQQAFETWNEAAKKHGWPTAQHLVASRPQKLRRTIKDVGGQHAWRALLEKCGTSEFLCGKVPNRRGGKPFVVTLDWITTPANLVKVMDGNYFGAAGKWPQSLSSQMQPVDDWARRLRDYKPRGFWLPAWGPRPEEPDCRAPAEMLAACRKRLGITVAPKVVETREQRLAAMIVAYRNNGHYDRANKIEEELAALEGRPPVLVPAPEVAHLGMPERQKQSSKRSDNNQLSRMVPRADTERDRRMAHHHLAEPPPYTDIPEGDYEIVEDE